MKNTDLHTHSYYSDGQLSPKALVRLAEKRKIKNLALTDHTSIKGVKEAIKEGRKIGVNILPAVEIRAKENEVLGYFIDINSRRLNKELLKIGKRVENRVKDFCEKLRKEGYNIDFNEIVEKYPKAKGNLNEFHILYTLYLKKYGKSTFFIGKKLKKLKKKGLKKKKIKEISIVKAVKLIKNAGGVAVLAHPWLEKKVLKEKNIKKYIKAGLKGIEINNGDRAPLLTNKIKNKIRRLAKNYNLILTSGSDYHGPDIVGHMPGNHQLGKNNCDEKVIKQLEACL